MPETLWTGCSRYRHMAGKLKALFDCLYVCDFSAVFALINIYWGPQRCLQTEQGMSETLWTGCCRYRHMAAELEILSVCLFVCLGVSLLSLLSSTMWLRLVDMLSSYARNDRDHLNRLLQIIAIIVWCRITHNSAELPWQWFALLYLRNNKFHHSLDTEQRTTVFYFVM